VSDEFIVPVCRLHHRELHRSGNEAAWWQSLNIDPIPVALRLWQHSRGNDELAPTIWAQRKVPHLPGPQNLLSVAAATECWARVHGCARGPGAL
jgi:hypothetical protein